MSAAAEVYARALFELACDRGREEAVLRELGLVEQCFRQEPKFLQLLRAPQIEKAQRLGALEACFGGLTPCLLNFLKLLTQKGRMGLFFPCAQAYRALFNEARGILEVSARTAVPLRRDQFDRLKARLEALTGKKVQMTNTVEPALLGGVELRYDGLCVADTVRRRLDTLGASLAELTL